MTEEDFSGSVHQGIRGTSTARKDSDLHHKAFRFKKQFRQVITPHMHIRYDIVSDIIPDIVVNLYTDFISDIASAISCMISHRLDWFWYNHRQ